VKNTVSQDRIVDLHTLVASHNRSDCNSDWSYTSSKIKYCFKGRAIVQAVSRWLSTAADWVQARVCSCGICGGQSGAGAGFLQVLWFPLPIFIPPIASQSPSSIVWGLYNRPEVATVPRGLSAIPLKKKYCFNISWVSMWRCSH
jgi:hypothetical protein